MTKTNNHDDQGKIVHASNAYVRLKRLKAAYDEFSHEGRWIDWLSESVPDAFEAYLQISSDLDEISEQLTKKHKKSPIEALSPKARAELTRTLGSVLELSQLLKKRVADASRINWCLINEFHHYKRPIVHIHPVRAAHEFTGAVAIKGLSGLVVRSGS